MQEASEELSRLVASLPSQHPRSTAALTELLDQLEVQGSTEVLEAFCRAAAGPAAALASYAPPPPVAELGSVHAAVERVALCGDISRPLHAFLLHEGLCARLGPSLTYRLIASCRQVGGANSAHPARSSACRRASLHPLTPPTS